MSYIMSLVSYCLLVSFNLLAANYSPIDNIVCDITAGHIGILLLVGSGGVQLGSIAIYAIEKLDK